MKSSVFAQNIFPGLDFDESTIRAAFECLFEDPCSFYYELKKAFIQASYGVFSVRIESLSGN
jgi:hypothetical protein